jgi:hypothetical protein
MQPLVRLANREVSFARASSWVGMSVRESGWRHDCPACGSSGAYKGYRDHGWCHSCRTYFTPVKLLAVTWPWVLGTDELDDEDIARRALAEIGYRPIGYGGRWAAVARPPDLDLPALGEALRIWCAAEIPGWDALQYDEHPRRALAACLGRLPRVTAATCEAWLAQCKKIMVTACAPAQESPDPR